MVKTVFTVDQVSLPDAPSQHGNDNNLQEEIILDPSPEVFVAHARLSEISLDGDRGQQHGLLPGQETLLPISRKEMSRVDEEGLPAGLQCRLHVLLLSGAALLSGEPT